MPETYPASVAVLSEPSPPAATGADESRNVSVLALYQTTLARSLNERNAFDAAVRLYRSYAPDLPEDDARRVIANIICRKP